MKFHVLELTVLMIYLPILNFLSLFFFGRYFGKTGSVILTASYSGVALLLSIFFFIYYGAQGGFTVYFNFGSWLSSEAGELASWVFTFDALSITMSLAVLGVSFFVNLYSFNYMAEDPFFVKFLSYLSLFTFFMTILIFADNLVVLFLGWEGVGLCSYLLIGFWSTRIQAGKSALKALFMNRIGDFFIVGALIVFFKYFKSTDVSVILALSDYFKDVYFDSGFCKISVIDLASFFIFLGAVGKSAQLGLHTWLPDAMEGPTPVSALIHAATMVTAGIFLVIRCSHLIDLSETTLKLMVIFGVLTSVFSGLIALGQWDLKKIIAFSTCSQLGYMFAICGISSYSLSFFHLTTHAFFKALLFLTAGYIIHMYSGEQDIRKMGSVIKLSPFAYIMMLIASLSLMGFIGFSGFYSKEALIHVFYIKSEFNQLFWAFYMLMFASIFLTMLYSWKLIYYTFLSDSAFQNKKTFKHCSDLKIGSFNWIFISLTALGVLSIFFGYFVKEFFLPGSGFFNNSIGYSGRDVSFFSEFGSAGFDFYFFLVNFFFIILNFFYTREVNHFTLPLLQTSVPNLDCKRLVEERICETPTASGYYTGVGLGPTSVAAWKFFNQKFYIDVLYNYVVLILYRFFFFNLQVFEKGLLEILGPSGVATGVYTVARAVVRFHSGYLHHYAAVMILSAALFICFCFFIFL